LRKYTKEKKEYRINALIFRHRGYQRKLLYFWRVAISQTCIKSQPDNGNFYYMSYIWIKVAFEAPESNEALKMIPNKNLPLMYYPDSLEISKSRKYSEFNTQANKKLSKFIKSRVFNSWRDQIRRVADFKNRRKDELLGEIISFWK